LRTVNLSGRDSTVRNFWARIRIVSTSDSIDQLTPQESDLAVMFYDVACNYPAESFLEVAHRVLGPAMFSQSKHISVFRLECQRRYDLAHKDVVAE
jgi:hypothetical protein